MSCCIVLPRRLYAVVFLFMGLALLPCGRASAQTITTDTTWKLADSPIQYAGWLTVESGATLTIEPGVEVRFGPMASGLETNVVFKDGAKLDAQGTEGAPIVFTADTATTPTAGFWAYLKFEPGSQATIDHCSFLYGGQYGAGALTIQSDQVTVTNTIIRESSNAGIEIGTATGSPTIMNVEITDCGTAGVRIKDAPCAPTFDGLTVRRCPEGIRQESLNMSPVYSNLTFEENDADAVACGVGSVLDVVQDVTIQGTVPLYNFFGWVRVQNGYTMKIEPGVTIACGALGSAMQTNFEVYGGGVLNAQGTAEKPITITHLSDDPQPGGWAHVYYYPGSSGILDHCNLTYGGQWNSGTLRIESSDVEVLNCTIENSSQQGIMMRTAGITPRIENCTLRNNAGVAIYQSTMDMNPTYRDLVAEGNEGDYIHIDIGDLNGQVEWNDAGIPYLLSGWGELQSGARLYIGPGAEIWFGSLGYSLQGNIEIVSGAEMIIEGEPLDPVIISRRQDQPDPGSWSHLMYKAGSRGSITNCILEGGGQYGWGALNIRSSDVSVMYSKIINYGSWGVRIYENARPTFRFNQIYSDVSTLGMTNSTPQTPVNAKTCWWGDASGPYHATRNPGGLGEEVSDGIGFEPWAISITETENREADPILLDTPIAASIQHLGLNDYRLDFTNGDATNVLVRMTPDESGGEWKLLGLMGGFPNGTLFDWEGAAKDGTLEIPIPDPETGPYYFSVYYSDVDTETSTTFEIACLSTDRYLSSLAVGTGGNAGTITETVSGLGFESGCVVQLQDQSGTTIKEFTPSSLSSSKMIVPMDLNGLSTRVANFAVVWPDMEEKVLADAFEITEGIGGILEAKLIANPGVRPNRESVMWLEYENTGDADMGAPYFILKNTYNTKTRLARDLPYTTDDLPLLGARMDAPVGTLPPGFVGRVPIYFLPEVGDYLSYDLQAHPIDSSTIDWEAWKASLQPNEMDATAWDTAWPMVKASLGANWDTYYSRLIYIADRFAARGQNNSDVNALIEHHVLDVTDYYPVAAISGWVEDADTGAPLAGALVKAIDVGSVEAMVVATADKEGHFLLENLADATYSIQLDLKVQDEPPQIDITNQQDVNGLALKGKNAPPLDDSEEERPPDTNPVFVSRGTDSPILIWQHGAITMARTFSGTETWGEAFPMSQSVSQFAGAFGDELLGTDTFGYIVAFEGLNASEERTIFWSLARIGDNGLEFTEPVAATDATHEDIQPAVVLDKNGVPMLVWLQRDDALTDDTDMYYALLDPANAGAWPASPIPPKVVDVLRDDTDCFEFTIGMGTSIPFVMQPIFGKSYKINFFGNKCNGSPSCTGFTQSISGGMNIGFGDILTGNGTISGSGTYGLRKNPCRYVIRKTQLSGSAALTGELDRPIPVFVWPIPYPVGTFYPSVQLGGSGAVNLIWEGNAGAMPNLGNITFSPNGGGGGAFYAAGTKDNGGLVGGKATINISGNIVYDFVKGWNWGGFCVKMIGEAVFLYGHGKRQITSSWGKGCGGKDFEPGFRTIVTDKKITRISRYYREDIPVETIVEDTIDPFTGTGNTYEGDTVLADVSADLYNDGKPCVIRTPDGETVAVWRKMTGDYATALGGEIVTASWDGAAWSAPTTISSGVNFVGDPVVASDNGNNLLVVWPEASSAGLDENSPILDVLNATEQTKLTYVRRVSGTWETPALISPAPSGVHTAPSLCSWGSSWIELVFLNQENDESHVYAMGWSGSTWQSMSRISYAHHCEPPTIARIYYGYEVVWAQDGDDDPQTEGDQLLYCARSGDAVSWYAPVAVPLVPVEETTSAKRTEKDLLSFLKKGQRSIPAVPDGCCGPKCPPKCPPTPRPTPVPTPTPYNGAFIGIFRPRDPNEKVGTDGWGGHNIVSPDQELTYTIYFENVSDATAPAQEVFVTDDLDPNLDWSTFQISEVAWGDQTVAPSGDGHSMNERAIITDYRADDSTMWWVDIEGSVDPATGRASFAFHTLDPETGELPMDVLAGFLPPNDETGRGEGHITFRISPKSGLADDLSVRITNVAKIVFDTEKTIETNEVFHTLGDAATAKANVISVIVGLTQIIDDLTIYDMNDDTVIDAGDMAP
ncbi:right-handed parallel beta-helix repeat-containing protein [bacterium]|nr:right-handed parallel beta-helix repeat-containing protein [bacterium]